MRTFTLTLFITAIALLGAPAATASTKDEIIKLQQQVEAMQKDLDEIKKLLQSGAARQAPTAARFDPQDAAIGDSPVMGDASAPVTLIEYSDFQCPFCSRHYRTVLPTLISQYVDTGKLKYVMRENPIPSLHRNAFGASLAALCAQDQGQYWAMHNQLFDNQRALGIDDIKGYAASIGLDTAAFNDCLDSEKYAKKVNDSIAGGAKLGVSGTPGFFIGKTDPEDPNKVHLSVFIRGAQSLANFQRAIDGLLGADK